LLWRPTTERLPVLGALSRALSSRWLSRFR
jgi:hypothetical protein